MNNEAPTEQTPGIGHNRPNAAEASQSRAKELAVVVNAWIADVKVIDSEEQATKVDDLNAKIKAEIKDVEKTRTGEKRPHLDANLAIDATYNPIKKQLETMAGLLNPIRTAWLNKLEAERREAERKANEEAMRKMQEAEDARKAAEDAAAAAAAEATNNAPVDVVGTTLEAEDAAKVADKAIADATRITKSTVGVKGNYAARKSSLRTIYSAQINDYATLLAHVGHENPRIKAVLEQIAGEWARSPEQRKTTLPGVKLESDQKAT